ncbi:conserved protein of unknown function (plasmid) [Rhodovastum atsumiense]|uniref:Uncharacterized protein n=1 Tax=Rhodovastum atsumiense TaxID=504468 RepID=A0A5M6IJL6_9PROT|nr:hypothetical protein [Rhodovastum atsumiense]KAA5608077.1 hypothetical protein F1189_30770 [Rhodovastum atsumiense]CAH2606539.1 conserved protein of unknown function [Rhodovastum atsumiense]
MSAADTPEASSTLMEMEAPIRELRGLITALVLLGTVKERIDPDAIGAIASAMEMRAEELESLWEGARQAAHGASGCCGSRA